MISALTVVSVVAAGCANGAGGAALSREAIAIDRALSATQQDPTSIAREFDHIAGSGTGGIDPVEALTATQQQSDNLTGDIKFTVPSGTFRGQVSVQLSTAIANAQIRYTTNGTVPTGSSTLYQPGKALVFTATTQLRAQAFVDNAANGAMGTAIYIALATDATHDLPLLVMDAYGAGKPARDYRDVGVMLMDRKNNSATLSQAPTVATRAGFHLRGQSSANFEKAPYRLELWNNQNADADYPLLNMPADSDWVLRGPFPDKTLIRDAFAYTLGQDMGIKTPRFAFVELYLNLDKAPLAAEDYQGVYMLVETIEIAPQRLNLQKLTSTDVTMPAVSGGYILQFNSMAAEPPLVACTPGPRPYTCWRDLEVVQPKDLQPQQLAWITDYIQKFHDALRSTNPANPQTGYPAYIDVNSFINRIIHNELAREADSYIRSTHFYKDRDGKLVAGPLWDYDLGYAAYAGFGGADATIQGWQFEAMFGPFTTTDWFVRLMQDPSFSSQVNTRWQTLRRGVLSNAQLSARIKTLTAPLANAAKRNFARWPILDDVVVGGFQTPVSQTWEEQLRLMEDFVVKRAAWLDGSGWRPTGTATQARLPLRLPTAGR